MRASNHPGLAIPKGPSRNTLKGRKKRAETKVIAANRAKCVERDGYCRFANVLHLCKGPSEWAHLLRRSATRGMPPDLRHDARWSLMLCQWLHREFDAHRCEIAPASEHGADGRLVLTMGARVFVEGVIP